MNASDRSSVGLRELVGEVRADRLEPHPFARSLSAAATVVLSVRRRRSPAAPARRRLPLRRRRVSSTPTVGSTPSPTAGDPSTTSPRQRPSPRTTRCPRTATGHPRRRHGRNPARLDPRVRAGPGPGGRLRHGRRARQPVRTGHRHGPGRHHRRLGERGAGPHRHGERPRVRLGHARPGRAVPSPSTRWGPYYCRCGRAGVGDDRRGARRRGGGGTDEGAHSSLDPNALPRTGSGAVPLALLALGLAVAGTLTLRAGVRRGRVRPERDHVPRRIDPRRRGMTVSRKMLAVLVATAVATMWIGVAPASAVPASSLRRSSAELPRSRTGRPGRVRRRAQVKVDVRKQGSASPSSSCR